jgi:flagellar biosynthetic protein FliQ
MTPETVLEIFRTALTTAFWVGVPLLALGFLAGIALSLIQILTSIQDAAFSAVPRLLLFLLGTLFLMPWMMARMITYTSHLFGDLARYAR